MCVFYVRMSCEPNFQRVLLQLLSYNIYQKEVELLMYNSNERELLWASLDSIMALVIR